MNDDLTNVKITLREVFEILDRVETSEEGREFHPTFITTVRSLDGVAINLALHNLKAWAYEDNLS